MKLTRQHTPEARQAAEAPVVDHGTQKAAHALPEAFRAQAQAPLASELAEALQVEPSRVISLITLVEREETTGGNCGSFAIALANVLGPSECEYALSSAEWGLDQPTFGHIGLRFQGSIYDGSGLIPDQSLLNKWAEDENLAAEVRFVRADEGCEAWVLGGTDCSVEPEEFERRLHGSN